MLQTVSSAQAGAAETLPSATETGLLGVHQLKRAWARQLAKRAGRFDFD